MKAQISYKNILKASLATVILVTGLLAILIWIFGDESTLQTEIVRSPSIQRVEEFKKIESPVKTNLTTQVSEAIAKEIAQTNPQGPAQDEAGQSFIGAMNAETIADKTIQEGLKNFNPDELRYKVLLANINLSNSNVKESQAIYFDQINNIIGSAFEGSPTMNYAYPEQTNFQEIISRYENAISNLYKTKVPSDLLSYHINLISLLGTHKNVYATVANLQEDPLQAYLAAEFGLQVENELAFLSNDINQYIEDNEIFES
jgi:hypothetical protein